jgi:hypothetical protein
LEWAECRNGTDIETESGNLVREGQDIKIYEYGSGYKTVEFEDINEVSRIALLEKDVENLKLKLELLLERQKNEKNSIIIVCC